MIPDRQKFIQEHVDAIPAILYADSNPESIKTISLP